MARESALQQRSELALEVRAKLRSLLGRDQIDTVDGEQQPRARVDQASDRRERSSASSVRCSSCVASSTSSNTSALGSSPRLMVARQLAMSLMPGVSTSSRPSGSTPGGTRSSSTPVGASAGGVPLA
jgi:hypothetical protein